MKAPRYTDLHRYGAAGYRRSVDTDITETFERVRAEQAKRDAEQQRKVQQLQQRRSQR